MDDGSTDGSFAALTRLHAATTRSASSASAATSARRPPSQAGFLQARGEIVVTIDGDLQDDPAEIPRLLAKLEEGFDLVSGWKTQAPGSVAAALPVEDLQLHDRPHVGPAPPRHELRLQGLSRRGRQGPQAVRRAAPLHPCARPLPRLPHRRAPRQPPATQPRPLALRGRAIPAWVLRSPVRLVPRTLQPPAAPPVRRPRATPRLERNRHPRST